MADELTVSIGFKFQKGAAYAIDLNDGGQTIDVSSSKMVHHVQNIGTSEEPLDVGDLTAGGIRWAYFKNLDATNYVTLRTASGASGNFAILLPGESCALRLSGFQPYAVANTAAINLEYVLLES